MNRDRNDSVNRNEGRPMNDGDRRYHVDSGEHGYDQRDGRSGDARTRSYPNGGEYRGRDDRGNAPQTMGYDDRGSAPSGRAYDEERGYAQTVRNYNEERGYAPQHRAFEEGNGTPTAGREDRGYIARHRDDQGDWTMQRRPSPQDRAVAEHEDRGWGPTDRLTQSGALSSQSRGDGRSVWMQNQDMSPPGQMRGKGPKNYVRSDQRTHEDVCEALTHDEHVDASQVEVKVEQGVVTLTGTVTSRDEKRRMEDVVERVAGVKDVSNQVKVHRHEAATGATHPTSATGATNTRNAAH